MSNYKEYIVRVYSDRKEWFNSDGDRHREHDPAIEFDDDGYKAWYLNGKLHREDGPAIEEADGYKAWYLNGKRHREDGPAIRKADGYKAWYLNGERHREGGPAIEWPDGYDEWYLNGKQLTEDEFNASSCHGKIVTIEGKQYRLEPV